MSINRDDLAGLQRSLDNLKVTIQPGSVTIGTVDIDQSTPGTTNGVVVNAGTNLMGKVGIDQTTPGTTNAVAPVPVDIAPSTVNITIQDTGSASTTGANSQPIVTGTPTASSFASFSLSGRETVTVQVTGTWTGTLTSEVSMDGGTTWYQRGVHQAGTSYTSFSFTANFEGGLNVAGYTNFRMRATAPMTGTATVKVVSSVLSNSVYIANSIKLSDATVPSQQLAINSSGAASITGNTGGFTAIVSSTVVMSVAGAYATGDYMGTTTTPQSFSNAVRTSGGTGIIKSLFISDKITTTNVSMELWLFSATFTAPTDNAAWAISDGEALTVLGVIPILTSGWYASSNNQIYSDNTLSIPIKPAATSLFYALVARGTTPAFTSQDLTINLGILQD